jgi:hypothetical protein
MNLIGLNTAKKLARMQAFFRMRHNLSGALTIL